MGGFCPGGFCPGDFIRGVYVLIRTIHNRFVGVVFFVGILYNKLHRLAPDWNFSYSSVIVIFRNFRQGSHPPWKTGKLKINSQTWKCQKRKNDNILEISWKF